MNWQELLPAPVRSLLLACEIAAGRLRKDTGDVSILGTVIIAAGLGTAAVLLVAAITGKLQAVIAQIPG